MLALVDGEPRLLPLKRVLIHYLEHRQEIITRRSRYLLARAGQRAEILQGLLKALADIDQVVAIIRHSQTAAAARANLIERLQLTESQVQAILDMPLRRLTALEQRQIADENQQKRHEIEALESLLRSPDSIRQVIRQELLALKAKFGDARRTHIVQLEKGHHTARDLVEAEDALLNLWPDGQLSRMALASDLPAGTAPLAQVSGDTRDDVAFFTASGRAVVAPFHQVPQEQPVPLYNLADLERSEVPVAALVLPRPQDGEQLPETYLTLVTRQGRIKRITVEEFLSTTGRVALPVINLEEGDQLAWVMMTRGQDEILLATRRGKAIRFSEQDVRPMGLSASGVLAVKLGDDDSVVGSGTVYDEASVVLCTEQGYVKRTAVDSFPVQKRHGSGVQAAKLSARTGLVAVAALASESQDIALLTHTGHVARYPVNAIHALGRAATGYKSPQDSKEPYFDPDEHGPPVHLTVLASAQPQASATKRNTVHSAPETNAQDKE
jgi:DNA gyrase subunit A